MFGTYSNKYDFLREVLRMKRLDESGQKEHVKKNVERKSYRLF